MGKLALVVNDVLIGTSSVVTIIHCQIGLGDIGEGGHIFGIIGGDLGQLAYSLLHACGGLPSGMACCVVLCVSVHRCALSGVVLSRSIRFETRFHRPFKGAIDVFRPWEEPFLLIIALIAVLVDGEIPLLHLPRVFQPTNGRETSIILPIQIEELPPVTRDIQAMGVAYDGGIEVFHSGCNVRLDRVGYPSYGGASRARCALARTFLGIAALRLLRALYLNH